MALQILSQGGTASTKINQLFKLKESFFSFPLFSKAADQYAKLWGTHSHITNEQIVSQKSQTDDDAKLYKFQKSQD